MELGELFICHTTKPTYLMGPHVGDAALGDWGVCDILAGKYGIIIDPEPIKYCDMQYILVLIDGGVGYIGKALIKELP